MNDRFAPNNSCLPNNYPTIAPGDKRVVILILTDFSAFNGNGAGVQVPVVRYGAFYVTGWDTSGSIPNCTPAGTNEAFPGTGKAKQSGAVWGGVALSGGSFGQGVAVFGDGTARGDFQMILAGTNVLGVATKILVVGWVTAGAANPDGSASISGTCRVDMQDGTVPSTGWT